MPPEVPPMPTCLRAEILRVQGYQETVGRGFRLTEAIENAGHAKMRGLPLYKTKLRQDPSSCASLALHPLYGP